MSGREVDVRIVPHGGAWAVKLTGGLGNKPVKITSNLGEARVIAKNLAWGYQVPLIVFDSNGTRLGSCPWNDLPICDGDWDR